MRRAQAQTVTFPAFTSADQTVRASVTFLAGEVQISKEGGEFANVGTLPTEIGSSGVYALPLTAAETDAAWLHVRIAKTGVAPIDLGGATTGQPSGVVVDAVANSATTFVTDRTESLDDYWKGTGLVFTSGATQYQVREVVAYNGTTKAVTLDSALTAEPAAGARFLFINI